MALVQWLLQANLPQVLLVFLIVLIVILATQRLLEDLRAPPGPWGLPILGYQPFLDIGNLSSQLKALSEKYGKVFSIRVGQRLTIVLSDYDSVKETLIRKSDLYSGRREGFCVDGMIAGYEAFSNTDGEMWKSQRRFILSTLRDFGFAKLSLEGIIHEETEALRAFLTETNGQPQYLSGIFNKVASNIMCHLTFGVRYDFYDKKLERLLALGEMFVKNFRIFYYLDTVPLLRLLPASWLGYNEFFEFRDSFAEFVKKQIAEHEQTFDPNNIRDVIDTYLLKIYETEKLPPEMREGSIFTRSQLEDNARLLFLAGADGIASSILWAVKFMLLYPKIQKKVQEELDRVVGRARLPSMNDKANLPYTEATVLEILRCTQLIPVNIVHTNIEETELNGYTIPRRSYIIANFSQIHFDPKLWKNPEEFNPSRYLNEQGKVVKPEYLIPFSTGGRICAGESLARMEIFLFFTSLLQSFNLMPPMGEKITITSTKSSVRKLESFKVRTVLRK